ncbi:hypothetical protein WOLCODRAFT_137737 [Wolfiporia cocos MD-104 SS10]|uniref:HTH APSES-type domain-containing protein n=1 Tax=Wolfiporia cocos (strain MD-104) TaxID=742152 RepID=A0A2H3JTD8_WOLCO|nr:hypothetical protein WOLCODRAFT_137737 [Wolfiporia cocos MD-104 SS10]
MPSAAKQQSSVLQTRPPLPVQHANPHIKQLDPSKAPMVKFQEIYRDGYTTIVGRLKIPTPNGHAFILRRLDTGAISLTTMFRAAFPTASEEAEKAESIWVKTHFDLNGTNRSGRSRFAGTWITPEVALTLAGSYNLADIIPALARAVPDPNVVYRRSSKAAQQPTPTASPAAAPAPASREGPVPKRRREASPVPSATTAVVSETVEREVISVDMDTDPEPIVTAPTPPPSASRLSATTPTPRRSTRTRSPAPPPVPTPVRSPTPMSAKPAHKEEDPAPAPVPAPTPAPVQQPPPAEATPAQKPAEVTAPVTQSMPTPPVDAEPAANEGEGEEREVSFVTYEGALAGPAPMIAEQTMQEEIAEQKALIERLKREREARLREEAAARIADTGDAVSSSDDASEVAGGSAKRPRENEDAPLKFQFAEHKEETEERAIAGSARARILRDMPPQRKSLAWGALAFAAGLSAMAYLPEIQAFLPF